MRATVDQRLQLLQADNGAKLDEMRRTVDEKLHATLEQRLGESFKLVSERLEAVHKGLGEMQALAAGVGDLKRVLTNVKSRGTWGECWRRLIEDNMTPDQYASNIAGAGQRRDRGSPCACRAGRAARRSGCRSTPSSQGRIRAPDGCPGSGRRRGRARGGAALGKAVERRPG